MRRAVLGVMSVWVLALAPPADAAFPGQNGKIVFSSNRDEPNPAGCNGAACNYEIYTMNPDGSGITRLTFIPGTDDLPKWSPDGKKIVFNHFAPPNGTVSIRTMNADGTGQVTVGSGYDPSWSPDGTRIVFAAGDLFTMNADGTGVIQVGNSVNASRPSWSPSDSAIAYTDLGQTVIYAIAPDGTGKRLLHAPPSNPLDSPDWSPDATQIAFMELSGSSSLPRIWVMNADGTNAHSVTAGPGESHPAWSPDGSKIVLRSDLNIAVMDPDGSNQVGLTNDSYPILNTSPSWQPIPINSYPRPKGATPLRASLTIAYKPCTSPNREHGAPLTDPSCFPPDMASQYLTVGTGDANGMLPRSEGGVRFDVVLDKPATPADESDVKLSLDMSDVFTKALADYAGELRASVNVQATDRNNTPNPGGPGAATTQEFPLGFSAPCTPTGDTTVGSVCSTATSANALIPGLVKGGLRSLWELRQVQVFDGGSDSDGDTLADNTLFAIEGVFAP